jgi:hypothetical protein
MLRAMKSMNITESTVELHLILADRLNPTSDHDIRYTLDSRNSWVILEYLAPDNTEYRRPFP